MHHSWEALGSRFGSLAKGHGAHVGIYPPEAVLRIDRYAAVRVRAEYEAGSTAVGAAADLAAGLVRCLGCEKAR
jgi:hypothetical protein